MSKEDNHLEIYGEWREDIGMKAYLHGPMDYAKKPKLRFRAGALDLLGRKRCTSSRDEEDMDACARVAQRQIRVGLA